MQVKTIGVSKGRTINVGDYSSVKYEFWMEVDGVGDEKVEPVKKRVEEYVDGWDNEEFEFWMEKKRENKGKVWK